MRGSKSWRCRSSQSARSLKFLAISSVLGCSVMLSLGCVPSKVRIPDPNIPHQVATETKVDIWVRGADGSMAKVPVRLLEGWWVASPQVVDPPK